MSNRILVVDDDPELRNLLNSYLTACGFEVALLDDGRALASSITRRRPALAVLDVALPGLDGLGVLRDLRNTGDDLPVILTSARADESDRVIGFEFGADDYLVKPFNPRELVARIRAVLRRHAHPLPSAAPLLRAPYRFGHYTLDFQARTLRAGQHRLAISESEFALLKVFVDAPMRTLTRDRLRKTLHGPSLDAATDRTIDVAVWRLRRVLEANPSMPRFIQTVRGLGYIFVPDVESHDDIDAARLAAV
ncbi:response regulator [Burkholderia plantarii]|uniref:response regulator n=1 Tax=Burkholderia plantarii TaxID=41899 RepID=UPI0006D89944|nr:response regulator [Burkholderia plantarii]ALK32919.1 two component transcriptional regulator [Burkholderia plantarii]GLZ20341.1 DNA-binding response regulator [Burkholderia plantarii]